MTDEIKLLTDQRSPIKKWADENRRIVAPSGRLVFPDFPVGGEIDLMRHRKPTFDFAREAVLPKDDPRAVAMRRVGATTGRFGSTLVFSVKAIDRATQGFRAASEAIRRFRDALYYGQRVATLLNSKDPRQRKRGRRLADKRGRFGDWAELEARALVHDFREEYPDIKKFWDTQLGEPYDPARYRKD